MAIAINGSGTITGISVGGLPNGIVDTDMLANNAVTSAKATGRGKILQVVQTKVTAASTVTLTTGGTFYDITPLNRTITPASSSSKFLINAQIYGEADNEDQEMHYRITSTIGGSTNQQLAIADAGGSRTRVTGTWPPGYGGTDNASTPSVFFINNYLDSPGTASEITYQIFVSCQNSSKTFYLNRSVTDSDVWNFERGVSWLTVMEVAS